MLEVLTYPDPRLKRVSTPVDRFDESLHRLLDEMAETMRASGGIGLAAPQVGIPRRCFIVDLELQEGMRARRFEFLNPRITSGRGITTFDEGCLSVPGVTIPVRRFQEITVSYQDRNGTARSLVARDLLSVAIQHESDHLDGILFLDRLPFWKRLLVTRRLKRG